MSPAKTQALIMLLQVTVRISLYQG